ncbi:unnamed protein product [Staurois parvus]|uniref:Uncharacterized protein n=1 Tax=Staurois parvus TaxID=386267 RepID=A0ABN9EFT0_9NEOB|nr:unnamed protein product [Staurois parvus]
MKRIVEKSCAHPFSPRKQRRNTKVTRRRNRHRKDSIHSRHHLLPRPVSIHKSKMHLLSSTMPNLSQETSGGDRLIILAGGRRQRHSKIFCCQAVRRKMSSVPETRWRRQQEENRALLGGARGF